MFWINGKQPYSRTAFIPARQSTWQYSGTPLYGHPDITDSFVCPDKKLIFSLKLTRLIRTPVDTDNGHFCVPSDELSYIVNTALRTPFICVLSMFNLSKGLSNIQFNLPESQSKSVSTKKSHGLFQMIPFSCFKNNKVILVRDCD